MAATLVRHRDFALLCAGMTVSLLGDGIYLVAIAWLVYDLSNSPTALSLVGVAWSLGMVLCLLPGGVASDRLDRRAVMVAADLVRLAAVLAIGLLAVTGGVEVWHIVALSLVYGAGEAFFGPSFSGLLPQLVPKEDLVAANGLQEVIRPGAMRLAGPAVGGVLVGAFGAGTALLVDAGTFLVSIACVLAIRTSGQATPGAGADTMSFASIRADVGEGLRFVRSQPWLWATLIAACVSILCFFGPVEVLLPYLIRNDLHRPAGDFGLVLAAAGAGAIVGATLMTRGGLPRRRLRAMYLCWGFGLLPVSGYAVATATWQLMVCSTLFGAGMSGGMVIWATLMQTRVPSHMLGRVTSLDWLVSIGLTPVSFALTAPVAALAGQDATLAGAGLLGAIATLSLFYGVGDVRRDAELFPDEDDAQAGALRQPVTADALLEQPRHVVGEPGVADVGGVHPHDLHPFPRS
ncbi:MAG: major facilitator superfamily protein [Solirubrobacterales bacterium]|nr:major facilitator superfamily protein [Solirubrobacterales bacterium]